MIVNNNKNFVAENHGHVLTGKLRIKTNSKLRKLVSKSKITTKKLAEWKRKILQEVENKIISLKHRIKNHKTNPVSKQDEVIEYLHKLHKKYALASIDKPDIIC